MTLKEFLDACSSPTTMVELYNDGETTAFATFSVGTIDSLLTTIQSSTVGSFTFQASSKLKVVLA